MAITNPYNLPEKDLATYHRQRCINILEKITKNLFRMFRDTTITQEQLVERFSFLKKKLDDLSDVYVNTTYHREMRIYIDQFANMITGSWNLDDIRDTHMTKLNRIQKLRNETGYKKEKHSKKLQSYE